jgi:hypothetical protein
LGALTAPLFDIVKPNSVSPSPSAGRLPSAALRVKGRMLSVN